MIEVDVVIRKNKNAENLFKGGELEVGFWGDAYPDGKSVAKVATFNEYGGGHTPPRPFMRYTVKSRKKDWVETVKDGLLVGLDSRAILDMLGGFMKEDIKRVIEAWAVPPNAPSTIKRKGFNNPLIETGRMMKSVRSKVK